MDHSWQRAIKQHLPSDWEQIALTSKNKSTQGFGAYLWAQRKLHAEGNHSAERRAQVEAEAVKRFHCAKTTLDRAGFVVTQGTPTQLQESFKGTAGFSVSTLYDHFRTKKNAKTSPHAKGHAQQVAIIMEFVRLLSVDSLSKAWRAQAAIYSTDRPGQGDAIKAKRLNELWGEVKPLLGTPAPSPTEETANAAQTA
jgi:hypothetical protein